MENNKNLNFSSISDMAADNAAISPILGKINAPENTSGEAVTGVDNRNMTDHTSRITVLGVGNILLTDEGLGVHVVNALHKEYSFTPSIDLLDGGTMGMELLGYMEGTKKLLLVDAINGGKTPGTVYQFLHDDVESYFTEHISVHEVGMQDILRIHALQGEPLDDAVVIGVEPASLEIGLDVSPTVKMALPAVKQLIIEKLEAWGIEVKAKND